MPPQNAETSSKPGAHTHILTKFLLDELTPTSAPETIAAARQLLLEYGQFVASHSNVASFCYGALEQEAANLPHSYLTQNGGVLLASLQPSLDREQQWLGSIAWRSLPDQPRSREIKRLWVRPQARGLGLGRLLIQAIIDRARVADIEVLHLDTAPEAMDSAYRLYHSLGFKPCEAYNGGPTPGIVYMRKQLE